MRLISRRSLVFDERGRDAEKKKSERMCSLRGGGHVFFLRERTCSLMSEGQMQRSSERMCCGERVY
jgi:hypothetical protein